MQMTMDSQQARTCYICTQCGTQYAETAGPPMSCVVCSDERQFVNPRGQQWTTHADLKETHRNTVANEGHDVIGIGMTPDFAIGQRALLVRGTTGLVMWDSIPLLHDAIAEMILGLGGLQAIAISHPHFHASMVEWAHKFRCPVYVHIDNRAWIMRADPAIHLWEGESLQIAAGCTLIRCGGHFPGSAVLHYEGRGGEIFTGDTFYVNPDHTTVGWMYSFPNHVPISAKCVRSALEAIERFSFGRVYSAWWGAVIRDNGKTALRRSAERYIAAVEGKHDR